MNGKTNLLALKRKMLTARIARQRLDLAHDARILEVPLGAIDKGISFLKYMKAHPVIPAAAAVFCFVLKPGKTFRWARRIWFFAKFYKNVRNKLAA